ncbi:MAG: TolC family protein [Acidobacteria bacterium]|nr:TolC family protein [Acidobacteriota bacterium]
MAISTAVVLCIAFSPTMAGSPALAPGDLVRLAMERNRDFLAAKQRLVEAQGLLRQAGVRPFPTVEFEGSTGRALGTAGEEEFAAGYFQPIETFGKREKRIRVAQVSLDLAQSEIADRIRQLTFDVKTRYADAVAEQEKLEAIERLLDANRDYYRLMEARVEAGDAAPLELALLLADLSRSEAQQVVFAARSQRALVELKKSIGLSASEPLVIARDFVWPSADLPLARLQSLALEKRPDLHAARLLEERESAEVSLARAEARPDLTVSVRFSRRNSRFEELFGSNLTGMPTPLRDRDHLLTFGASLPLFSAKRNQGNIEATLSRLGAARLRREHSQNAIPQEVEAAFGRWVASRRAAEILSSGVVERSEKNLEVIRQAYQLGQLRFLDVLNEHRRLVEIRLAYIDALAEQFKAFTELEQAVGGSIQ